MSETTAKNIKYYRRLCCMSQETLARKAGISVMSVRRYEDVGENNREPSADLFDKLAEILGTSSYALRGKNSIKDSGERTKFETGAVRDMHTGKGRMDLLPFHAILELSKHCENGAIKYEEHNVEKGIPQHSLIDSGMRHLFKYAAGYTDEDHLLAALWNIAWAVNQRETHPELIDVPWKGEENE